jgi:hypothetical protein
MQFTLESLVQQTLCGWFAMVQMQQQQLPQVLFSPIGVSALARILVLPKMEYYMPLARNSLAAF